MLGQLSVLTHPVVGSQLSSVQAIPSLQLLLMSVFTHPVLGLQVSVVHRL